MSSQDEKDRIEVLKQKMADSSPLTFPRAIGFGISIGVNNFLKELGLELNFVYFLWGIVLYLLCVEAKSFMMQLKFILFRYTREVCLVLEWIGYVQEVVYTFIMTNIGIWATDMYEEASRPKPAIYAVLFVFVIGIILYQHKYSEKSFFTLRGE